LKICYLLLVHHKFDQALRLVRRLAGPSTGFVVHIDSAADQAQAAGFIRALEPFGPVSYPRSVRSRWGSYSQALAIVRSIQAAVGRSDAFDRYVLMSGQDYPIASRAKISEFFAAHSDTEFIETFLLDLADAAAPGWSPYYRLRRFHLWLGRRHFKLPILRKPMPPQPIYHGSTWWALTRAAVLFAASQFDLNKQLRSYLSSGFLVDEVYVPSLVMNSPFAAKVAGQNVTFAQWTPTSGPHPKILRFEDLDQLLASPKLFARKFDELVDKEILDKLDTLHSGTHP